MLADMPNVNAEELAVRVRPALTKLYVLYFRRSANSDLSGPQLTILSRLEENGPSRISRIAELEDIRMPTASNALHQLEQLNLVERIRDTKDRRGVQVQLTDHGREELERVNHERNAEMARVLEMLPPEKLARTEELVDIITELAEVYGNWKETDSGS
ncbi:MarR family winged helix-turn-helix transcriptional regulator [Corynebacterium crudilactis]|uniref:MarR family transcriptional regulator n=1 Tax=Corynebacterium crudilactis TaxID=1652495 RepID=A0A172QWU2_9CORY|nr:MarR family transcriptional regulator [Corynebacterium crudilactis]ANE05116.1 MarR family transcriptional regulator [Corynebacterium crudilactis]